MPVLHRPILTIVGSPSHSQASPASPSSPVSNAFAVRSTTLPPRQLLQSWPMKASRSVSSAVLVSTSEAPAALASELATVSAVSKLAASTLVSDAQPTTSPSHRTASAAAVTTMAARQAQTTVSVLVPEASEAQLASRSAASRGESAFARNAIPCGYPGSRHFFSPPATLASRLAHSRSPSA